MAESELNIVIKLIDEASAKLNKIKDNVQGMADTAQKSSEGIVKGFRNQIQPLNLLMRTITRVGFIWGLSIGLMVKGVMDLGKEINNLDILSAKLGISASELSKKFYGFDITTQANRAGVESLQNMFFMLNQAMLLTKSGTADLVAEGTILNKLYGGPEIAIANLAGPAGLAALFMTKPKMSREDAIAQIHAENQARQQASKEGQAAMLAEDDLFNKLSLSKVEYARRQFSQQIALMQLYGVDTTRLQQEFNKQTALDRNLELINQGAARIRAEGDTTRALYFEQNVQLANFKKIWGQEGAVVDSYRKTQKVLMNKAVMEAWISQMGAVSNALGTLEMALAGAEEMGRGWATAAATVSLAMAIINTAEGITKAWAVYGWNPPLAATISGIIAAAGAIQIATIAATKFHEGGIIKAHDGLAVDEVPIIAQRGEGIISRRGMASLGGEGFNRINSGGGMGSITINMEHVSFRNEDDIEDVMIRLSNLITVKTRSKI